MKKRILCFCLCLYCIGIWAADASFKKTGNDLLFLLPQGKVKLEFCTDDMFLSLIHISEPTRRTPISYAVFCLKKKKKY